MRRLQPPPTGERCDSIGQDAALRNDAAALMQPPPCFTSLSPPLQPGEVFSVGVELHPRSLCTLHPEHILRDERDYGFEETKRLARDKRICFTAMARGAGNEGERDLNSVVVVSSHNGRIAKLSESRDR